MHVDAAYAGVSAILPEMAQHFRGLELAHSFDTNPHKWLLTNFDMSTLYVRDATYLKLALTLNPSFLQNKTNEYDYKVCPSSQPSNFWELRLSSCCACYCPTRLPVWNEKHA